MSQLLDNVQDNDVDRVPGTVDTCVSDLRRKLDNWHGEQVHTVRGVGYAMHAN